MQKIVRGLCCCRLGSGAFGDGLGSHQDNEHNGAQQPADQRATSGMSVGSAGLAACSLGGYAGNSLPDQLAQQQGIDPQQQSWQSFTQSLQQCAQQQQQQQQQRHSKPSAAGLPFEVEQLLAQVQQQQRQQQQQQKVQEAGVAQGQPNQVAGAMLPEEAQVPQAPIEASTRRVLTYQEHLREEELKAQLAERTGKDLFDC